MKPLIITASLFAASCLMPTDPDTSASTAALGASWYDVRNECRRVCSVVYAQGCALTRQSWWWPSCLSNCDQLATEAQAAGCLDMAEDWQRCEWAEQSRTCIGVYPYVTSDNCHAETDGYIACRSDS